MQVSCFGLDWTEVQKRPDARAVVEEMIYGDAGDRYVRALPEGMWTSDSATLHFESADLLLADWPETNDQSQDEALRALSELITTGDAIDELGISPLTEGCYFLSSSTTCSRSWPRTRWFSCTHCQVSTVQASPPSLRMCSNGSPL